MQIKENLNSDNSLRYPHQLDRYIHLFYGVHVCTAGVISKLSPYCSNGNREITGLPAQTKKSIRPPCSNGPPIWVSPVAQWVKHWSTDLADRV